MKRKYLEWNISMWNEMELFGIDMSEKECSRSVPKRNATLHRKELDQQQQQQQQQFVGATRLEQ